MDALTPYAPRERLRHAFELAQTLAPLHYATTYHRDILPHVAAKWQMERMLPGYVRMLLKRMPAA